MVSSYRYAHILFGGFTQRVGRAGNGMFELFDELYHRFAAADSVVEYFPWYVNPRDVAHTLAERNEKCSENYGVPLRLQIVGYSFGGQTAANVCRELDQLPDKPAVTIDHLSLCDAVARCGRLGWLRAANPFGTIRLPRNIHNMGAFVQRHRRWRLAPPFFFPAGQRLVIDEASIDVGAATLPIEPRELPMEHDEIDGAFDFRNSVLEWAAELHRTDSPQPIPCVLPVSHEPRSDNPDHSYRWAA